MSSQHQKHLALAAGHFTKLAAHHKALAQIHKDMAQQFFSDEPGSGKAAEHHLHGQRMAALHKSAAAHHLSMVAHAYDSVQALRQDGADDGAEPNPDEMTEDNVPSFGSNTFEGAAHDRFSKDFGLAEPMKVSAVGTLSDPRKIPSKLVFRPGQEELLDPFGKAANGSDEHPELPGMPG
jgi:hypothetical protein